jgi:hypothetical protein
MPKTENELPCECNFYTLRCQECGFESMACRHCIEQGVLPDCPKCAEHEQRVN